ncbi:hypothetical protein Tco_1474420 [Tanacetum coccineum]
MTDFAPGRAVINATQRKRVKYEAKCETIGYEFLPFSFSSLEELEEDAVTLLKRIRKLSMTQDLRRMALWKSQMEDHTSIWLRAVLISGLGQTMNDHVVSYTGIIGIKHRHNVMRDTLVDICYRSGFSARKEIDIGLEGGRDKLLRPADLLLYTWNKGLDVCLDLAENGMTDFAPSRAVIDAAQLKRVKYKAKCVTIGYAFLPFSFSSLRACLVEGIKGKEMEMNSFLLFGW